MKKQILYATVLGLIGWICGTVLSAIYMAFLENTGDMITAKDRVEVRYGIPFGFTFLGCYIGAKIGKL